MTREEFDKILIEEGILSKKTRDDTWKDRPPYDIEEEHFRKTAQWFKEEFPLLCEEDK